MARRRAALAPCCHGRWRGRRAVRDGLGRDRSRQTGRGSSAVSTGSVKVMRCPKAWSTSPKRTRDIHFRGVLRMLYQAKAQIDHGVADGRAGGESDPVAGVLLVQVLGFHVQVKGAVAASSLDAGHPLR